MTLMIGTVNASDVNNTDSACDVDDDALACELSVEEIACPEENALAQKDCFEDIACEDNNDQVSNIAEDKDKQSDNTYTFTDLNDLISSAAESLNLKGTYKYSDASDSAFITGVPIKKNLKITGQNCIIDGSNTARCLNIFKNLIVTLDNITIINGFREHTKGFSLKSSSGAGISVETNVEITIKNCVFKNNKVYNSNGAALIANENCRVVIDGCIFENNTSIRESNLKWGDFKAGMASAIYAKWGSTLRITNSNFKSNNAYLTTVLLVSYHNSTAYNVSKLYVKDCRFEDNTAEKRGVIYLDEFGEGKILDSVFINNHSPGSTGIVVLDSSKSAVVKNCLFEGNDGVNGAGIYLDVFEGNSANVKITDCRFINNFASNNGGAIYSNKGLLKINNCLFENNRCKNNGGAVYSTGGSLTVSSSVFSNNNANNGGAIYSTAPNAYITDTDFANNHANNKGAAVYLTQFAYLNNCRYYGNYAPKDKVYSYGISNNFKVNGNIIASSPVKITYGTTGNTIKFTLKNSNTKQYIVGVKLKIKVYTGKTYKTYYISTDDKGSALLYIPKLSAGTHKLTIVSAEGCVLNSAKTISLIVYKAKAYVKAPKVTKRFKHKSYFKITVKYKTTKKAIPNIKVKIKITTKGKKTKTIYKKTNKKGIIKISTKSLARGKHKVKITSANSNIAFTKKSTIIIRR